MLRWNVTVDWNLVNALERLCKALPFKLKCKAGNHTLYSYLTTHIYKETIISVFLFRSAHCSFSALLTNYMYAGFLAELWVSGEWSRAERGCSETFLGHGAQWVVTNWVLEADLLERWMLQKSTEQRRWSLARLEQLLYSILVLYMPLVSFVSFYFLPEWLTIVMRLDFTDSLFVA